MRADHRSVRPTQDSAAIRIRIVVVADQPLRRWALWNVCAQTDDLLPIGDATGGDAAVALVESLGPDVVAVDCSSAEDAGWALVRELRDRHDGLGIVVVTSAGSDDLLFRALETGASAYIEPTATISELLGALRHAGVAAGSFSAAGLAQALQRRNERPGPGLLSPREREVLALLRDGHSVPEVAALIYVSLSTAKTYVGRIYEKLGAANRAQALMAAVELGLFDVNAPAC